MLIDEDGYIRQCDWCGEIKDRSTIKNHRIHCCSCEQCAQIRNELKFVWDIWPEFTRIENGNRASLQYVLPRDFPQDLCVPCATELTPWVQRFADVYQVHIFNQRLGRAINEQRKNTRGTADHRATSDNAGQCCERGHAGTA